MSIVNLNELTEASLEGTGAFDRIMRATKAHLDAEYSSTRLRGPEYAEVYLGAMQAGMTLALQYVLQSGKAEKEEALLDQQILNAEAENAVLVAQKCKLDAEFDVLVEQKLKTSKETALLAQKLLTERAQTVGAGVDVDSVIGKQKTLYERQADGFLRDAEQKAAKTLIDTWNVRRTTDTGTIADTNNNLDDLTIGRTVTKLIDGVQA